MENFNNVPNSGTFGNVVSILNQNFSLSKIALERLISDNENLSEKISHLSLERISCLGFYDTAAALSNAHPTPNDNDWALVGTGSNLTIYVAQNEAWVSSGATLSLSVDLTNYVLKSIYNNAMQEHNTRIVKLENDTIVFSPLYDFTDVEDLLIRYTASERGEIISQSAGSFKLRIYTGIAIGQHLRLKFTGNLGGAQAYAFYSTANLSEMGASTCLTTSTTDESNMAIKCDTAASNTYDIVVPDNAVALVITLYDPAIIAKANVEVATPDVRIGEAVEKNNKSINGLTQRITNVEDTQASIITALPKKLTVTRNGDVVVAVWNDGKGHELVYTFGTISPKNNQGYGLLYVRYRPVGSTDIGTSLQQQYESDMIGPLGVNNVWCGGAHRIELADKSLVRSIGNITKHIYANGAEVNDGDSITCDELTVVVSQEVYAPNATNTGLVLLCQETVTWKVHADVVGVSVVHDFTNSECAGRVITTYYGMQTNGLGNLGDLQTMTLRGRFPVLQTISNSASSYFTKADFPHFNCFVQYRLSDGWCVSAKVNPEIGIGDHSYVGDTDNIFVTGPSKLYHRLIAGKAITAGMKYVWQGVYRFGHLENKNEIYNWIMDK